MNESKSRTQGADEPTSLSKYPNNINNIALNSIIYHHHLSIIDLLLLHLILLFPFLSFSLLLLLIIHCNLMIQHSA